MLSLNQDERFGSSGQTREQEGPAGATGARWVIAGICARAGSRWQGKPSGHAAAGRLSERT